MNSKNTNYPALSHHRLNVWHSAVELVALVCHNQIANSELRDQATRAAISVGPTLAAACGRAGQSRKAHFRSARGSVLEVSGAYELAPAMGEAHQLAKVQRLCAEISAMLWGLVRP
jgi:four helix bundle protein